MTATKKRFIFLCLAPALLLSFTANAQYARSRDQARYEIDAKRQGVNPTDKDALPRSREFLRLDSTYYVGWMYEGIYKYDRSTDYLGYKNAVIPLQKAFDLIDKDYGPVFRSLYTNINNLIANFPRYQDLYMIFTALKECYDNLEMPDQGMALVDRIASYRFINDYGFELCYQRSWMYHRNRFQTSKQHAFLKNSVQENEHMALQWCYNGLGYIDRYAAENEAIFGPAQSEQRRMTIYHNLALLHCYNKNYDSSEYYYEKLAEAGRVSWNNFGEMQSEIGHFAMAQQYLAKDMFKSYEHFLREPYYYLPELFVYAGKTKDAIRMTQDIISESGSTPGFGWYNIALARSYLYDGQLDSCEYALNKAANFKEIHIGTTLTQSQYDFTINLLRVQLYDRKLQQEKFLHEGWWYSPASLYNITIYKAQKMMAEYVVANQLANNPERNRLVYDLFCAEATTTFDEAWYLMKDFSPKFFLKKYQQYQKTDKRNDIQRYFKLFAAKFQWEEGDKKEAAAQLEELEHTTVADTANEKLFIGRLYETLAKYYEDKDDRKYTRYAAALLDYYPQLLPFSGIKPPVSLTVSGARDATTDRVINDLKNCNISFDAPNSIARASVTFVHKGNAYEALLTVTGMNGKPIVSNAALVFRHPEGVGGELGLRLFGKGGAVGFEPPPKPSLNNGNLKK